MAKRQEQERAREEVEEVAPNVLRMQLPITMPGLGHVNCYGLVDDEGVALVDPGLPTGGSFRALERRLKQAGLRIRDVHTVLVTHSHPDHFGGASRIVRESGAKVMAHVAFRMGSAPETPEVSVSDLHAHEHACHAAHAEAAGAEPDASPEAERPGREPFTPTLNFSDTPTPWGGARPRPPLKMRLLWQLVRLMNRRLLFPTVSHPVDEGDVLRLAGREWFVVHTPGHTEDHFCLHNAEDGVFLAGDHVLPSITPHISGLSSNRDPLAAFFDSLDRAAATPQVKQVLPAHGHPFADLAGRCEAIKRHHDERLAKVKAIAREIGPASVEAFMQQLFKSRSWGAMAESETYAHLEHIRLLGQADVRRDGDGRLIYEL